MEQGSGNPGGVRVPDLGTRAARPSTYGDIATYVRLDGSKHWGAEAIWGQNKKRRVRIPTRLIFRTAWDRRKDHSMYLRKELFVGVKTVHGK